MDERAFAVTWDYRCPFARNAHEHLLRGLQAGAKWEVTYAPFSLSQVHVAEGDPPVWENPAKRPDLLAMEAAIAVRDKQPEQFPAVHEALFRARHDESRDLRDEAVVRDVLASAGADVDAAMAEVADGWTLDSFKVAHEQSVDEHAVFGVPTFVQGDQAVFVRVMTRPGDDGDLAIDTIERVLALLRDAPDLNEYKHTSLKH